MNYPEGEQPSAASDETARAWPSPRGAWLPRTWQVVLAVLIFAAMFVDVVLDGPMRAADQAVARWVSDIGTRDTQPWSAIGTALSLTGQRWTNVTWILILSVYIWFTRRTLVPFVRLGIACALLYAVVYPFKNGLGRSFPTNDDGDYFHAPDGISGAFPSGHQSNAVLLGCVGAWIAVDYIDRRWIRTVVYWYAVVAPLCAAIAVVLKNYHWVTDVIAGVCIGTVLLWVLRVVSRTEWGRRFDDALTFSR